MVTSDRRLSKSGKLESTNHPCGTMQCVICRIKDESRGEVVATECCGSGYHGKCMIYRLIYDTRCPKCSEKLIFPKSSPDLHFIESASFEIGNDVYPVEFVYNVEGDKYNIRWL